MLSNIFYYAFYASAVFVYGMGTTSAVQSSIRPMHLLLQFARMLVTVLLSVSLSYLLVIELMKLNLGELCPFVSVAVFLVVSLFAGRIIRLSSGNSVAEYGISFLCIVISIMESVSFLDCLFNCVACLISFFLSIPVMYSIRKKIEMNAPSEKLRNLGLLFISIGVLALILISWGASWLNPGVLER